MLSLGVVAVAIFALGFVVLLRYAPIGQRTGYEARIVGVFRYDPEKDEVFGEPSNLFRLGQPFAAKIDWTSLPGTVTAGARWYNTLQEPVGQAGPASASELARDQPIVPVRTPSKYQGNLPGSYTLVVLRYTGGRPVEVLGQRTVEVQRGA